MEIMTPLRSIAAAALTAALLTSVASAAGSPFATHVDNYSPRRPGFYLDDPQYNDPQRAIGAPVGISPYEQDNTSVVTLGDGGSITLSFDHDVLDDSANPGGYDFIVFSNSFLELGDPPGVPLGRRSQEPAFVEISQDGNEWFLLLPNKLPSQLKKADVGQSTTVLRNYAEYTVTLGLPDNRTADEFYTVPDRQSTADTASPDFLALLFVDEVSGGGDAFDIAAAVKEVSPGVPMLDFNLKPIPAGITSFKHVRMTDAVTGDVWMGAEVSSEIDAAADIPPASSVGAARRLPEDGNYAVIWGAKVTATFPCEFWIEQPDRSAGLKIISPEPVSVGQLVAVTGHVTDKDGDKAIQDPLVTVLDAGTTSPLAPVGISNRSAALDMASGLLVRVWGNRGAAGVGWFNLEDGSGQVVKVNCGSSATIPGEGAFAVVTGILSRDASGTPTVRLTGS